MKARSTSETSLPIAWPLAGSLVLTALVVPFVCERPLTPLHSWAQLISRATVYLVVAAAVHALAVWGVCRVRDETESADSQRIWTIIWAGWIAIVWLPLLALLTSENSPWVALVLPTSAVFATLLLKWNATQPDADTGLFTTLTTPTLFQLDEAPPLWRTLAPAVFTAVSAQLGLVLVVAGHAWFAGCLLAAATLYPLHRWLTRQPVAEAPTPHRPWRRTSAGNSLVVWLLLIFVLVPFLAIYTAGEIAGLLGMNPHAAPILAPPSITHRAASNGYSGIILIAPRKPHEVVVPVTTTAPSTLSKPRDITFDGAYWYFKQPDTRPEANARVAHGDPVKNHIFSTDTQPLVMEAHQPLGQSITLTCCRSVRINVTNADNVPGTIAMEIILREVLPLKKTTAVSLGTIVLPTSKVSPMPLNRAPVPDTLTFNLPREARGHTFNEITVRIKPEHSRSLAGAQVAIKNFILQP